MNGKPWNPVHRQRKKNKYQYLIRHGFSKCRVFYPGSLNTTRLSRNQTNLFFTTKTHEDRIFVNMSTPIIPIFMPFVSSWCILVYYVFAFSGMHHGKTCAKNKKLTSGCTKCRTSNFGCRRKCVQSFRQPRPAARTEHFPNTLATGI